MHARFRHPGLEPGSSLFFGVTLEESWMPDQVRHDGWDLGERMTGGQVIALSGLIFAALILSGGTAWFGWYVAVPVLLLWLTGIYVILRRRAFR